METSVNNVADHFPKQPKDCKLQAQTFFSCFSLGSAKLTPEDADAGIRGIQNCLKEKKAYDSCMYGWEKKYPAKRYRVQEEYRQSDVTTVPTN